MIDKEYTDKELCEFASAISLGAVGSLIESEKPKRIQRKRTKGWKMPENTVSVTRPGKWGNPYKVSGDMIYGNASYRRKIFSPWIYIEPDDHRDIDIMKGDILKNAIQLYRQWLNGSNVDYINPPPSIEEIRRELKGKNLACFCPLGKPCHADVLLEIANS